MSSTARRSPLVRRRAARRLSGVAVLAALAAPLAPGFAQEAPAGPSTKVIRQVDGAHITRATAGNTLVVEGRGLDTAVEVAVDDLPVSPSRWNRTPGQLVIPVAPVPPEGTHHIWVRWADGTHLCARYPLRVRDPACEQDTVFFAKNRSALEEPDTGLPGGASVAAAVTCLAKRTSRPLVVLGFASQEGSTPDNMELSRQRAQVVAEALHERLPQAKILSFGLGETLPSELGDQEATLKRNRRALIVSGDSPCQVVRVPVGADGAIAQPDEEVLSAQAECLLRHRVATTLIVVPGGKSSASGVREKVLAAFQAAVARAGGKPGSLSAEVVFGPQGDRGGLARAFGMTVSAAAGEAIEVIPTAWFASTSSEAQAGAVTCAWQQHDSVAIPDKDPPPPPPPPPPPLPSSAPTALTGAVGYMFAFGESYLGGTIGVQREVMTLPADVQLVLGLETSVFGTENAELFAEGFRSNVYLAVAGLLGFSRKFGPVRGQVDLLPGTLLPLGNSFLLDGRATLSWSPHGPLELLIFGGGGVSVSQQTEGRGFYGAGSRVKF